MRRQVGTDRMQVIIERAERQHGVVSRGQLLAAGVPGAAIDVLVRRRRLLVLHRGVYAAGHRALRREGVLLAAALGCGPAAVVSHRSAAAVWDLRESARRVVDVTTRTTGRLALRGVDRHTTRRLDDTEVTLVDAIPVTTVERTLADLGQVLRLSELRRALERADAVHGIDVPQLERSARGRPGAPAIRAILADWAPARTHRGLEERLLALVRRSGLPEPLVNWPLHGFEVDLLWPQARLVVEADSRRFHGVAAAFERDRHRDAVLAARGHRVLRFTWQQVTRSPAEVVAAIRGALALEGVPS